MVVTRLVTPPAGDGRSFEELLVEAGIPALEGIDTRALTLELRRGAARQAVIRPPSPTDRREAEEATPPEAVDSPAGRRPTTSRRSRRGDAPLAPTGARGRAALVDFGVKRSLLRALTARGLEVVVLPHDATDADVGAQTRPGRPVTRSGRSVADGRADRHRATLAAAAIAGGPPILGICLGHQLLALAAGAATRRLAVGHHGGNHAVIETASGRVDIGAHNHEVEVVDAPELAAAGYRVSHRDLNDGTVEGLVHASGRIASVQFHPEGAPGPIDAARVFDLAVDGASQAG